jgi:DnaK suppressor protein
MVKQQQIKELESILIQKQKLLEDNIIASKTKIIDLNSTRCSDENDYADISSDSFTESVIIQKQLEELAQIKEALKSIQDKTYGICKMCDEEISIDRLKAKPFAKYCTTCREYYENK